MTDAINAKTFPPGTVKVLKPNSKEIRRVNERTGEVEEYLEVGYRFEVAQRAAEK